MERKQESFELAELDELNKGDIIHVCYHGVLYMNRVFDRIVEGRLFDEEQSYSEGAEVFLVEKAPQVFNAGDLVTVTNIYNERLNVPAMGVVVSVFENGFYTVSIPSTHPQINRIFADNGWERGQPLSRDGLKISGYWEMRSDE